MRFQPFAWEGMQFRGITFGRASGSSRVDHLSLVSSFLVKVRCAIVATLSWCPCMGLYRLCYWRFFAEGCSSTISGVQEGCIVIYCIIGMTLFSSLDTRSRVPRLGAEIIKQKWRMVADDVWKFRHRCCTYCFAPSPRLAGCASCQRQPILSPLTRAVRSAFLALKLCRASKLRVRRCTLTASDNIQQVGTVARPTVVRICLRFTLSAFHPHPVSPGNTSLCASYSSSPEKALWP